jgi:carboxymethylenebutenolidase
MAERLVSNGYAVLLPDLDYQNERIEDPAAMTDVDQIVAVRASIDVQAVIENTRALLAFLDHQGSVRSPGIAAVGYCIGGGLALAVAGAYPGRVDAVASIHGARLATDAADSPHLRAAKIEGEIYVGVPENDHWLVPGETDRLKYALSAAGANHSIETYPGTRHGFAMPDLPAFDHEASERHWDRLLGLLHRNLVAA